MAKVELQFDVSYAGFSPFFADHLPHQVISFRHVNPYTSDMTCVMRFINFDDGIHDRDCIINNLTMTSLCCIIIYHMCRYDLLKKCWILKPEERPVFEWIVREIELRTEEYYVV